MLDLKCGDQSYTLRIAPDRVSSVLRPRLPEAEGTPVELVRRALADCDHLLSSFHPGDKVVIVTSDVTRPTGSDVYLPMLVERLNAAGTVNP